MNPPYFTIDVPITMTITFQCLVLTTTSMMGISTIDDGGSGKIDQKNNRKVTDEDLTKGHGKDVSDEGSRQRRCRLATRMRLAVKGD